MSETIGNENKSGRVNILSPSQVFEDVSLATPKDFVFEFVVQDSACSAPRLKTESTGRLSLSSECDEFHIHAISNEGNVSDSSMDKSRVQNLADLSDFKDAAPCFDQSLMQSISESELSGDLSPDDEGGDFVIAPEPEPETDEQRLQRELEESERLALQLSEYYY